jgi:hypothetical protein
MTEMKNVKQIAIRQRDYNKPHTLHNYKSMINHTFHKDLHCALLHFISYSIFLIPTAFICFIITLQILHSLHLTSLLTLLALCLKKCDLQAKVACASAGMWFHSLMVLFTNEYFPKFIIFSDPNYRS